jgi:hypothetical protein
MSLEKQPQNGKRSTQKQIQDAAEPMSNHLSIHSGYFPMIHKKRARISIPVAAVKRLVLATFLLVLPATLQSCTLPAQSIDITGTKNMQSKDEKIKFMFADDETEEAAQKKLVQTFPVGSDISKFISAMKSMKDVDCSDNVTITKTNSKEVACTYFVPSNQATTHQWYISASNQHGKITEIDITKTLTVYYPPTVDYRHKIK